MIAQYARQAALVVKVVPLIEKEDAFALKGGTAINLFELDMPRLSVDIDLTFTASLTVKPQSPRSTRH